MNKILDWVRNSYQIHVILPRLPCVDCLLVVLKPRLELKHMVIKWRQCCNIGSQRIQELLDAYFKINIQWRAETKSSFVWERDSKIFSEDHHFGITRLAECKQTYFDSPTCFLRASTQWGLLKGSVHVQVGVSPNECPRSPALHYVHRWHVQIHSTRDDSHDIWIYVCICTSSQRQLLMFYINTKIL